MATLTHSGSRRLYSWWWDSHISPKNSKWLQENLTDMDVKVKAMIKLIEEDADSFARRAEMYYKKRPELMKLLEEIYRAYRALAERYDYATVELRQAHRTMAEAFPNQVPCDLVDESPSETSVSGPEESHAPEMSHPIQTLSDLDDLSISFHGISKRGHRQVDEDGFSRLSCENQNLEGFGDSSETEVEYMEGTSTKIEAEKESIFLKYQQALETLSNLETELKNAQQEAAGLDQRASKFEIEVKILKEALSGMEAERDANLLWYNQSLESISNLENLLSLSQEEAKAHDMRASKAKTETQYLRLQLSSSEYEKEASLRQYKQCLEKISLMEGKISAAEKNSRVLNGHVERAESEINLLKETINELNKEKETASLEKYLETVVKMESEISRARIDAKKLNDELLTVLNKLDSAEVKCSRMEDSNRALQLEVNNLMEKLTMKDQELAQRQVEFEKFQIQMHDEQSRFKQVETSLHTLQDLHSRSQDEKKSLTLELKNSVRMLKDLSIHKLSVEEELQKVKEENRSLKNLENEISSLKQIKHKLEEEVFHKADSSNALEREIHCLREEIKGMSGRYQAMMMEVESVGMNPESLLSSVKELQNENARLRNTFEMERIKGEVLSAKLNSAEKISKDNVILEISLAEMNEELEKLRAKAKDFQESCHFLQEEKTSLVAEKANLLIQLRIVTENMQKLLEKNTLLENSLCGANTELEGLRDHSKGLEEVCQLLKSEKSNLVSERDELVSQLANVELGLGTLEEKFSNLEDKYSSLENENETTIDQVEELRSSIVAEKEERASYKTLNETRMSGFETNIHILQQKSRLGKKEFEEELEKAVNAQVEIFILRTFVEDLEANNCSLLIESQKLNEASKFSNKLIAELERENLEQQVEIELLVDEIENLRRGIHRLFKAVQINPEYGQKDGIEREKLLLLNILDTVEELKTCLCRSKDEKQQLLIENSVLLTLLGQLGLEGEELQGHINYLENMFKMLKEELGLNEKEKCDLQETTRQLMFEATQKELHEKFLAGEIQTKNLKLENLRRDYLVLQKENSDLIKKKRFELEKFSDLKDAYHVLEEENKMIIEEDVALDVFSLVFESFTAEKALEMKALNRDLDCLHLANNDLKEKVGEMAETLVMKETEILRLNELVEKLDEELHEVKKHNDLLIHEIVLGNSFLRQKVEGLSETEQELKDSQELNARLCNRIEELKMECKDLTLIRENLEIENLQLCMDGHRQNEEIDWLLEMNENLKSEVDLLYNEVEECRIREDSLSSELQGRRAGSELWEAEAASFYFDLQASAVREVFLENKLHEITQVCEKIGGESAAKDVEIHSLRERYGILESEMGRLKPEFSATSLKNNVELNSNTNVEVRGLMKDREESKLEGASRLEIARNGKMALRNEFDQILKPHTKRSENGTQMKDIPLDQVSGFSSYRRSKRESREIFWETVEPKTDQSLISNKVHNPTILPLSTNQNVREEQNRSGSSSDIEREPVLGDDRIERSSSIRERSQGGKKRKILQRLASDAQKLTNLQTAVYDLNKRMETKNWSKKESYSEHEKVYKQLKEVEETVLHLVNTNDQLTKNAEQSPSSLAGKTASELEIENAAKNNMLEQTRKASEKIGRLHLEVQNIQLVLLKLEEEKKRKWKTRFLKNKTGIVLKEFIYNGRKNSEKDKKNNFCGCQGPPKNED